MFKIFLVLFSFTIFAKENCSKENVVKKVNEICSQIQQKGTSIKASWPKDLFYQNCGDNYVWVQDTSKEIRMIMHPVKQKMNGKMIGNDVDEKNIKLFIEFDKMAKSEKDGGWVKYSWSKPGQEKSKDKISFVKLCRLNEKESWVVGSGIWEEDLN